jgi:hypothetical protein
VTTLEQFSTEIFFEIFDYFTANEICKSFYRLNNRFKQLVSNAPNIHLDLTQTKTKLFQTFQQIFCEQNIVSLALLYENVHLLEIYSSSSSGNRLQSITMHDVTLREFEIRIPALLNAFKHQLQSLKIRFSDMKNVRTGERAAQSFGYLLTELPLLKHLTLEYSKGIDPITYMPATIVNNTIVSLTICLSEAHHLISLLYRFQNLKRFTLYNKFSVSCQKKALAPQDVRDYRNQIREKTSMEYPATLRHVNVYGHWLALGSVQTLLQFITPQTLFTLSFVCERSLVKIPIPRRQPPFLDGMQWHDLLKTFLPPTIKRFHIEYEDGDDTMSRTNPAQVKKEFIQYYGANLLRELIFSYNKDTKLISFDINFI